MTSLVCFALKEEAAPFLKVAAQSGVPILIVGIGRHNAEKSLREFRAAHAPERVFTCGFAGGLDPGLEIGEVVFEVGSQSPAMGHLAEGLIAAGAKPVRFYCADRIATTADEKRKLRAETGADAVEMESGAIQAVCGERDIACVTVRAISDTAQEDLPLDFNALAKPDKSLDFGKLALAIAKSPGKVRDLLALQRKTRRAAARLAAVLEKIISP